jgi:hypothetical protein
LMPSSAAAPSTTPTPTSATTIHAATTGAAADVVVATAAPVDTLLLMLLLGVRGTELACDGMMLRLASGVFRCLLGCPYCFATPRGGPAPSRWLCLCRKCGIRDRVVCVCEGVAMVQRVMVESK